MTELKPCCCGGKMGIEYCPKFTRYDLVDNFRVICSCGKRTRFYKTQEKAITAWNRREK